MIVAFDLDHALRTSSRRGLRPPPQGPSPPLVRLHGKLGRSPAPSRSSARGHRGAVRQMLHDADKLEEFEAENEVDFSYAVEGLARFRVNAFRQRGSVSIVMRAIPVNIKSIEELDAPAVITRLAEEERGIVLVTGTTGSGKSTTLAAMIDHINRTMHEHIVTIEDPIEFLHRDSTRSSTSARSARTPASFKRALRRVLRQDPDVILVGEMRDEETVQTALSRGRDRPPRPLDAPHRRRARDDQPHHRLLPAAPAAAGARDDRRHAEGRRLPAPRPRPPTARAASRACEILRMTGRVQDMIIDPKQTGQARARSSTRAATTGCRPSTRSCFEHLKAGRITMEQAVPPPPARTTSSSSSPRSRASAGARIRTRARARSRARRSRSPRRTRRRRPRLPRSRLRRLQRLRSPPRCSPCNCITACRSPTANASRPSNLPWHRPHLRVAARRLGAAAGRPLVGRGRRPPP